MPHPDFQALNFQATDFRALDNYHLLARFLHHVQDVDCHYRLFEQRLEHPIIPIHQALSEGDSKHVQLIAAEILLEHPHNSSSYIPLLAPEKMGQLMPKVRQLAHAGVPAIALNLCHLAESPPYGNNPWQPKSREDLAELCAAAGCPVWLYGISSPSDAEVAAEAGVDAIIVNRAAGKWLSAPATLELLPEIFDAIAGMSHIYAGGSVRDGIDIFKYLAVGADAVVIESDRWVGKLKAELEYAMRLTACETLADISYDAIFMPLFGDA